MQMFLVPYIAINSDIVPEICSTTSRVCDPCQAEEVILHAGCFRRRCGLAISTLERPQLYFNFISHPTSLISPTIDLTGSASRRLKVTHQLITQKQLNMPHSHSYHPTESDSLLPIHPDGESHRRGFQPLPFLKIIYTSSNKVSKYVNLLFPITLLALILPLLPSSLHISPLLIFTTAYIGMIPSANALGFAGQEFARKMPKVSGILIETAFGSVVEIVLFLVLILKHVDGKEGVDEGNGDEGNLIPIIQAAVLGSILTNLLLCLGAVSDNRGASNFLL